MRTIAPCTALNTVATGDGSAAGGVIACASGSDLKWLESESRNRSTIAPKRSWRS